MDDSLDIIAVMGGTNDWSRNIPLGTPDSTDPSTVYGALHTLASGLKEKYPNAYIFFMSPLPRKETWVNSQGYTVEDVAEAVEYVAEFHNLDFLDMYRLSGFENEMHSDETDGIHPSQNLIKNSITPTIAQFLKENYH
jgi:lysophospholipase L1-like esterase